MRGVFENINHQEEEQEQLRKQLRQEKAIKKFSKERFMKGSMIDGSNDKESEVAQKIQAIEMGKSPQYYQIKKNLKIDLMETLRISGVDFDDEEKAINWLNLACYDGRGDEVPLEINQNTQISARCLLKLGQKHQFVRGFIVSYLKDKEKYKFSFNLSNKIKLALVPRLYFCIDTEDPIRYCERISKAFFARIYADNLIKLNYYVQQMPAQGIWNFSEKQKENIQRLADNSNKYNGESIKSLLYQVQADYWKTMNSILVKKHLKDNRKHLIPTSIIMNMGNPKKHIPYYGLIKIKRQKQLIVEDNEVCVVNGKSFLDSFSSHCEQTIRNDKNVIISLVEIQTECQKLLQTDLFKIVKEKKEPLRFQQYQSQQNGYLQRSINKLKNNWMNSIKQIIQNHFKKGQVPWLDFHIQPSLYPGSKVQRYFKLVKFIMEDTIRNLSISSFQNKYQYIKGFIPIQVEIKSIKHVINKYEDGGIVDSTVSVEIGKQQRSPLFQTDLMRAVDDSSFNFATAPSNFVGIIMSLFNKMIDEITKVPEVQQKVMVQIFKKQKNQRHIKTPSKDLPSEGQFDSNLWLRDLHNLLQANLEKAIKPLQTYLQLFNHIVPILQMKPQEIIRTIDQEDQENPKDIQTIKEQILEYYAKEKEFIQQMPESIHISCFRIYLTDINEHLAQKYHITGHGLEGLIAKKAKKATKALTQKLDQIKAMLTIKPKDIEKLVEIRDYMSGIPLQLEKVKRQIEQSNKIYEILQQFRFSLSHEDLRKRYAVMTQPKNILVQVQKKKKELESKKFELEDKLLLEQEQFKNKIQGLNKSISQFHTNNKKEHHVQISQKVQLINEALTNSIQQAKRFNSNESLFEKEITDYSKVYDLAKEFLPYSNLWLTTTGWEENFQAWMYGDWFTIDAEQSQRFVEDSIKNLNLSIRFFREKQIIHILKIAESVKKEIDEFRPKIPLLLALRRNGLRERHWDTISNKVGFKVYPEGDFSFSKALAMGLMKNIDNCIEVSEQAGKQFAIENNLRNMVEMWDNINFQFSTFKNTCSIVKSFDDVVALVDDHIANTQSILFSPFKKPFEKQIIQWFAKLKRISDIMEEWTKLQINWMYLQPIFDSPDISKQLVREYKNFKSIDSFWRGLMSKAKETVKVEKICQMEDLLQKLTDSNNSLDLIQKSLNNYLEGKRGKFARFYFLGNNELLEILSQAKEPLAVQPYLKKVFENISEVEFDSNNTKTIVAMFSAEMEKIPFDRIIDPKNKNVEDWMTEVEEQMKSSIRTVLLASIQDYFTQVREDWVLTHPGQCVLNGSQIQWTKQVEQSIRDRKVKQYFDFLTEQMNKSVELVRRKLSKNQSVTLNAMIVIDVHARDVVESLITNRIQDVNSFEWISQLRYYWQEDNCFAKCVQTVFPYGYEYLGNTLRLVITPLTDKCYMTLMGALKLNLGGAPAGPAGTGKTQTTKDLAKALAKQCVVFNCSDSMDFIMVGKFFKGLASAGAWACFDEFNRINIQVLSVIAQQLLILFSEKAKGSTQVEFEGSEIKLQPTFSVFITMNPGYAGRTELPDNLKALFRPVAMMVPDYAMIGEIMLYSFGFKKGRDLAKKMVATFRLASEQLSSQDHYDYGMRAVRSVINAAGILKERDPDLDQDLLLLRALRDVNVPKFLKDDLPLFQNIIQDLFPSIERPAIDYGQLLKSINSVCEQDAFRLEPVQVFITKIIQLYDTIQVRHGLMLVGPTGGGKTSSYKVLKAALTQLQHSGFYKVNTHILNPKSINMGQLYGMFNEASRQWIDGVLAYTVRKCCSDRSSQKHWVMFDGPVDALWIENMNTVLDDNKKLCLNSGQILTLTNHMTMMFEVQDLAVASPATVSRCGMIYLESTALGISPLVHQWKFSVPPKVMGSSKIKGYLNDVFTKLIYPCIQFVKGNCRQTIHASPQNLIQSFFKNLNCYLKKYQDNELVKITNEEIVQLQENLVSIVIFCVIWSIGASTDYEGRQKFNSYLRKLLSSTGVPLQEKSYYEYYFHQKEKCFKEWTSLFDNFQIDSNYGYHQIIIPTADSQRSTFLTKLLLTNDCHVMLPGPTGTGKSINAYNLISTGMGQNFQYIPITFSAQTSANQTQDTIDLKLQKIKRGVFGAPSGKKYVIFVDDLNMPKKEEYGAQPPIQLLRQFLDHGGWYNRKDQQFMKIENIILLTALGPPGGGRTHITPRIIRHFNIISYTQLDNTTISHIFTTIVGFFLKRFTDEVKDVSGPLIASVIKIYDSIKLNLLPTPKKSHYTFNMRDISKVFQGICSGSIKFCNSKLAFAKLWYHEMERVFGDRLIDNEDRQYLRKQLDQNLVKLGVQKSEFQTTDRMLFCDFYLGKDQEPRHYAQVVDFTKFIAKIAQYQVEYNSDPKFSGVRGKNSMKLVLFQDACQHISRITRIIRQPLGNALLLGVGGSGRQSLAKMAIFISNHTLTFIELIKNYNMKSWREDIKKVLMQTGLDNKQTSFLFTDTQIVNEQMVEDLNSILSSGDVTGVYNEKDIQDILNTCKGECIKKQIQPNKMNIFGQYLSRIKQNIHIVMAMSPLSSSFSNRLRMFPSLVNCCTIDWFSQWPEQALIAVGKGQIRDFLEENNLVAQEDKIVQIFKTIHKSVEKTSTSYLNQLRRHNYVTPMSYLELLTMFRIILKQKQSELKFSINRLKTGLDKLIGANNEVSEMQIKLKDLQPQLQKSAIETQQLMKTIQIQKKEAQETQKIVSKQQYEAKAQTQEALHLAKRVQSQVQEANAKLSESLKAVEKLEVSQLVEIKSHKKPPKGAIIVLGGAVVFFQDIILAKGHEIQMRKIEGTIKKEEDWFNTARLQLLENPKYFLEQLKGYEKERINQALIMKFKEKIMKDPDFTLQKAKAVAPPIEALYLWEMAMYNFNNIYLQTQPLRQKEAEVKQMVLQKTEMLNQKKKILAAVIAKVTSLEASYNNCIAKKQELTKNIEECQIKLDRAKKLTSGLSDEKQRWTKQIQRLSSLTIFLTGNSILSASMISYGGAFTSNYRQILHNQWIQKINQLEIHIQKTTNLVSFLGKPVLIQQWTMSGLPKDQNSIENGIIIQKGRRWPLMIDPQGQANKFIKAMGKQYHIEGIDVVKESEDAKIMKTLELAVQNGKWFLLENVGKQLDQSLEPILLQQVVKSSGSLSITFGDKTLSYNDSFKMFMTTTLPNPHYSPQTFVKVTIINFAITPQGLQDQMLAELVALQNPQLEQKKKEIVRKNAADKKELLNIEDSILQSLSQGSGGVAELLLDETLINQLQNSKKFAAEINQRIQDSKITEEQIDRTREGYRSVAYRLSLLFFCIIDLAGIDPMYQYSLQWFINLFKMAIENALPAKQLDARLLNLINYFTYSLYENVCRSLFEKHKLLFSFMLTAKIEFGKKQLDQAEWRYFLAGPSGDFKIKMNPTTWISQSSWSDIFRQFYGLQDLPKLAGIYEHFIQQPDTFRKIFDSQKPQDEELPSPWNQHLDLFEKLIVLKAIRLDKVLPGIENWISVKMGKEFIVPPTFQLSKCFKDSTQLTPLIFLLSPGSDPVTDLRKFGKETQKKIQSISLGQGQGAKATELVKLGESKGIWILLQNCHLAASYMSDLQRVVEQFGQNTHKDFRLWLTSMPTACFPISVLQNSVKMTLEPPQGLRANLLRSYNGITEQQFTNCQKPIQYKKLLFGFCFFHAIIQDRRKFGPIGWNIAYQFTNEDLNVCKKQLKMLLDQYTQVPYKVLNYLGAEVNYGGRVTDDKDLRLIKTILSKYITPDLFKPDYKFSKSGYYYAPNLIELTDYVSYINNLPHNPAPEAFGLHENAQITTAQNQTLSLLQSILSIQPRSTNSAGKAREDIMFEIAQSIQSKTPQAFNVQAVMKQYPTDYNESMNTVLVQQLVRYNRLIEVMKSSLVSLKKALKGLVVMSEELQKLSNSLFDNQVGKMWSDKGFLSLKPLGSWIEDLNLRIKFLQAWIQNGTPITFWMSGLFFPQAFVTGSLQNYARKKAIAIDKLSFKFQFLDTIIHHTEITKKPQFGCYIYGLFLEGCRWNNLDHVLGESKPKQLFSQVPMMHFIPCEDKPPAKNIYNCPLYKVASRSGTLSTTGHSTNFVMYVEFPSNSKSDEWVCSGVAAFLALRY